MRVVIGEDETLMREGLALMLGQSGFGIAGTAADATSLVGLAGQHRPDLVLTDIRMPPGYADEGLQAALDIRRSLPGTAIVVLSQHLHRRCAVQLLAGPHGGVGYLLKQRIADVPAFCADLSTVVAGGTVLDPEVAALLVAAKARRRHSGMDRLTSRQREVLALMAEGRSNTAIAHRLSVTERAVVQHVSHIYDQLGLPVSNDDHRRVLAVVRYLAS
jgi:DNA-binding NarL/FixJ family response regulator